MDVTTPRRGRSSNTYNAFDIKPTEIDPGEIVFEGAVEPPVLVVTRDLTDACPELTAYQGHPCFYTGTYSRAHAALVFVDASGTFTRVGIERTAALAHAQKLPMPLHNTQSARIIDELTKTAVGDVQVGDLLGFYGIVDRSAARGKSSPLLPGGQTPRKSGRKKTPTRTYEEVAAAKALAAATAGGTASHSVPERLRRALRALRAHKKSDYDSSDASDDDVFTEIPYGQQMRTAYALARYMRLCMRKWEVLSLAASKAKAERAYLISNFLAVSSESEESSDDEEDTAKALKTFLQSVNLGRFEKGLAKLGVTSIEAFKNLDSAKALAWAKSSQIKPKATAGEIGLLVRYCQGKQLKKASKTREALGSTSSSTGESSGSSLSSLNTIIPGMGKTPKPTKSAAKPPPPPKQSRLLPPAAATAPKTTKDDTESLRTTPLVGAMVANIPNGMKVEAAVMFVKHLLPSLCAAVPAVAELQLDESVVSLEVAIESMLMTKTILPEMLVINTSDPCTPGEVLQFASLHAKRVGLALTSAKLAQTEVSTESSEPSQEAGPSSGRETSTELLSFMSEAIHTGQNSQKTGGINLEASKRRYESVSNDAPCLAALKILATKARSNTLNLQEYAAATLKHPTLREALLADISGRMPPGTPTLTTQQWVYSVRERVEQLLLQHIANLIPESLADTYLRLIRAMMHGAFGRDFVASGESKGGVDFSSYYTGNDSSLSKADKQAKGLWQLMPALEELWCYIFPHDDSIVGLARQLRGLGSGLTSPEKCAMQVIAPLFKRFHNEMQLYLSGHALPTIAEVYKQLTSAHAGDPAVRRFIEAAKGGVHASSSTVDTKVIDELKSVIEQHQAAIAALTSRLDSGLQRVQHIEMTAKDRFEAMADHVKFDVPAFQKERAVRRAPAEPSNTSQGGGSASYHNKGGGGKQKQKTSPSKIKWGDSATAAPAANDLKTQI